MPFDFDLAIIGAGPAGLAATSAARAAAPEARIALIEAHRVGGPRLWSGDVAIGALARSARVFALLGRGEEFGIHSEKPRVIWTAVRMRIAAVRDEIREIERSAIWQSRATLVVGHSRFQDAHSLEIMTAKGTETITAAKFIVATGREPVAFRLEGLEETGFLTQETLIDRPNLPRSLVFLGSGPAVCELAQAFRHLGANVTVITPTTSLLPGEEPALVMMLEKYLTNEGIVLHLNATAQNVRAGESGKIVDFTDSLGNRQEAKGTEVVVIPDDQPRLSELGMEGVGIALTHGRLAVDDQLRTLSSHIWAAGSVLGRRGTGAYLGGIAGHNAFAEQALPVGTSLLPHVVHTDPSLARIGPTQTEALAAGEATFVHSTRFANSDMAIIVGDDYGFARLLTNELGVIVGAQAIGASAAELVDACATWVRAGTTLPEVASLPALRPSQAQVWVRAARES